MKRRKKILDSEIASLADGSMPAGRRREIEDELNESASARESIERQRRAVEIVRAAQPAAPPSLHRAVAEMTEPAPRRGHARPLFAGVATALAVVLLALVLTTGGGPAPVDQAAALALAGPQDPAPKQSSVDARWLNVKVGGVAFPYWQDARGWRSYGSRSDSFSGRTARTVYYTDASGSRIAYTIVGGSALPAGGGTVKKEGAVSYRVSSRNGTTRVVWERGGHTCIISARGVPAARLQTLID